MTQSIIKEFTLRTFKYAPVNRSLYKAFQKAIDKINNDVDAEWRHLYNNPLFRWEVKLDTYRPLNGEPYKAYTKMLHVRGQHGYGFSIIDVERI